MTETPRLLLTVVPRVAPAAMPAALMLSVGVSRPEVTGTGHVSVAPGAAPVGTVVLGLLALLVTITSLTVTIALLDPRRREIRSRSLLGPRGPLCRNLVADGAGYGRASTAMFPPLPEEWQDLGLRHPTSSRLTRLAGFIHSMSPGRRIRAMLPALPSVEWMFAAVTRSPTPASPGRSGMHPRVAGARHAAQQPRRRDAGQPRAAPATRATRASSSHAQRSTVRSSPSRYRRMASVTEPGLTSPRRASSVRTATATHGPSTRKCRRRAARVSDRPKPSVPRDA